MVHANFQTATKWRIFYPEHPKRGNAVKLGPVHIYWSDHSIPAHAAIHVPDKRGKHVEDNEPDENLREGVYLWESISTTYDPVANECQLYEGRDGKQFYELKPRCAARFDGSRWVFLLEVEENGREPFDGMLHLLSFDTYGKDVDSF